MPSVVIQSSTIEETRGPGDSVTRIYLVDVGGDFDEVTSLSVAHTLGLPRIRVQLGSTGLFVGNVHGDRTKERRDHWLYTVTFNQLPPGEDQTQQNENPLLRPPIAGLKYIDREYVVKKARNVEALGAQFQAKQGYRAADTLGPIVNGALRRPDEPIVRTERVGVITIDRNYAALGQIFSLNKTFKRSTNSDTVAFAGHSFSARELKYECTHEGGRQVQNGIAFYPGVTEITIEDTTDLILDNVGFEYWEAGAFKPTRALDKDNQPTAEPINLTLSGRRLDDEGGTGDSTTQITYRDLTLLAYSSFFS